MVSTDDSMGVNTSRVRLATVCHRSGCFPVPPCRVGALVMLSTTMMALSTIMPTPSMRPDSEMTFSEMPSR